MSKARHPWWLGPGSAVAALILRLLALTWRVDRRAIEPYDAEIRNGARCIFALWHSRLLALAWTHRGRNAVILVSAHRDGEWIARVTQWLGFESARGSSTRGGEEGMRNLLRAAADGRLIGITPDGPRGPAERVKPGVAYLASRAGLPVVPVSAGSSSSWVLRSWDRFVIPKPFARVVVAYGAPISVPPDIDERGAEAIAGAVERSLAEVTETTRARAGGPR